MIQYQIADMVQGVKNMIEAADIRGGDHVLLLADRRSDRMSMEAISAGLKAMGAQPMSLVTEPISRYGHVPEPVIQAMKASDVVIWVWPVFITFTPEHRAMGRRREESGTQLQEKRLKPYFIYFEGTPGLLARDYAKFPNKVLWKLAEKVREVVATGRTVRIVDDQGTDLTATYDGTRLYGMQFRPGDPPGRSHFPWGRCGVFNGDGQANGEVVISCVQGVSGRLPSPIRWQVKDSQVVEVEGGELAEECRRLFKEFPGSNRLVEIMFGYHPKSIRHGIEDPMHWELISKMPWAGLGTADRKNPNYRHMDGSVMNGRLYIDDRLIVHEEGMLDRSLLHHPEVLEVASEFGDPYKVLAPVSHEAHGSGTLW
ncbi:MAG: hypothetical protein GTO40_09705 [Deltaproteobacteria bacterium]|nr:hypothetical protein [Deltaproteobacteria bacterium]